MTSSEDTWKQAAFLAKMERIVEATGALTPEERSSLETWERDNVTGFSGLGTSDWPGWDAVLRRMMH